MGISVIRSEPKDFPGEFENQLPVSLIGFLLYLIQQPFDSSLYTLAGHYGGILRRSKRVVHRLL